CDLLKISFAEIEAIPGNILVARRNAQQMFLPICLTLYALEHPFQNTHVFTEAWPDKTTAVIGLKPVHTKDSRMRSIDVVKLFTQMQPMGNIRAHAVAAEREHGEWVATHHALRPDSGCRCFRPQ